MKIDWIEATILHRNINSILTELRDFLGGWQQLERGGYGYECSAIVWRTGRVYWSPSRSEMGVHISLPSSALDLAGVSPEALIVDLSNEGAKFTRIDFAADDLKGTLDLEIIGKAVKARQYVARSKKWTHIENSEGGQTYGFGSRSSDSYIRIYDKAAEQNVPGHWIRVEIELKRERAQAAVDYVLSNCGNWAGQAASWILGMLDFKLPSKDSNKSRWDTAKWWLEFLGFVQKGRLFVSRVIHTADDLRAWIESQVTPSLFVLIRVIGWEEVLRIIGEACTRLKAKHFAMIDLASRTSEALA